GLGEGLVQLLRVVGALLRRCLLVEQPRAEGVGARDEVVRGEARRLRRARHLAPPFDRRNRCDYRTVAGRGGRPSGDETPSRQEYDVSPPVPTVPPQSMIAEADAEHVRALMLLLAALDSALPRLRSETVEQLGLLVRVAELRDFVQEDLERIAVDRDPPVA